MIGSYIIVAVCVWGAVALIAYALLHKSSFNLFDPLIVVGIYLPFSAAFLAVLCSSGMVSWDKFQLFMLVLVAYLLGARTAGVFFDRDKFRHVLRHTVSGLRGSEVNAILFVALCFTIMLAVLGILAGAQGDARQEFGRLFRPLVVLQNGLFLFALLLLLSPRLSKPAVAGWLTALVALSIPFSGKSILLPVLYWFGLKLYVENRPITLRAGMVMFLIVFFGVGVMGLLAYGASGLTGIVFLIANRFWLSGDVYLFAYKSDALSAIRGNYSVSFLSYMLHPVTSLVGMRAYDKPLGAMLSSEVFRDDLLTGPNPQLPVLLDFFFQDALVVSALIAFLIGLLAVGIRSAAITLAYSRSRYVRLGAIAAAIFCPAAGFLDFSLVLIALVGIVAVTGLSVAVELLFASHPRTVSVDASTASPS